MGELYYNKTADLNCTGPPDIPATVLKNKELTQHQKKM